MTKSAIMSPCRKFRYLLTRAWGDGVGEVVFILLNPSTADDLQDDATVRRCIGFAKQLGKSKLSIVNLFAYRSVNPKALFECEDAVGPENDLHIKATCEASITQGGTIICAWGNHGSSFGRSSEVSNLIRGFNPYCFGLTAKNQPRHPLYLSRLAKIELLIA